MYGYKTALFTRLGFTGGMFNKINESRTYDFRRAVDILLNYTRKSVENQNNKEFTWVFLCGNHMNKDYEKEIRDAVTNIPVEFIYREKKDQNIKNIISLENIMFDLFGTKEYINMRLDSDDYMHPNLMDTVVKNLISEYDSNNIVICGPGVGYTYYRKKYFVFNKPRIAVALGTISSVGMTVHHHHGKLIEIANALFPSVPVIEKYLISGAPLYIWNRDEQSVSLESWEKNAHKHCGVSNEQLDNINIEFKIDQETLTFIERI